MSYVDSLSERRPVEVGAAPVQYPDGSRAQRRLVGGLLAFVVGFGLAASAVATDVGTVLAVRDVLPPGHYLVLFQNNAEQRPSGGFIGTFATVDITPTGYENLRVDTNIYKRDNAFTETHAIEPPAPLIGVAANNRWAMRDSNWDLDFRDAAQRVSWFYAQEGGEAVDGVIAVNATVLQDVLHLTGPLPLPDSSDVLSADNFFDTLHYKIEKEYFYDPENRRKNEPKSIIRELIPVLLGRVTDPAVLPKVTSLLEQELRERHVQLYHSVPAIEAEILRRGWGGELVNAEGDYLLVNNASVGGQKSSLNIIQTVSLDVAHGANGLDHTLTLRRQHTGDGVWPDHTNNNYVRIAVPKNAVFQSASRDGIDVTGDVQLEFESGKAVFGVHLDTDPGETSELVVRYVTGESGPYSLYYQKQSGTLQEQLTVRLDERVLYDRVITTDTRID